MAQRRDQLTSLLRQRILRGLETGALARGGRLPSTRSAAAEYDVDPRVVLSAYRELSAEGLVELRERSGIFVARDPATIEDALGLDARWVVDVFADGVARDVPGPVLVDRLRQSLLTVRLRAVVVASTYDQVAGLCRELREDFALDASGMLPAELGTSDAPAEALRSADLVVTTGVLAREVRAAGEELGVPVVVIDVRTDLIGREWLALLKAPVYVVVTDSRFVETLRGFFRDVPGISNLRPLVVGQDDLAIIPPTATVYATQSARERLGEAAIPGRLVPPARTLSGETARQIFDIVVRRNWDAVGRG